MIPRTLAGPLTESATYYPTVTLTGPRQSGKTTLCRACFPNKPYVSLEAPDTRAYAREDPRGFLDEYKDGAILDEFQNVPELANYLQGDVDANPAPGRFILTGSQNLSLSQAVSQSLAGRTAMLHLLPPSLSELQAFATAPTGLLETLVTGAYPGIHDRGIPHRRWLADYINTYLQRDVRQLLNIGSMEAFTQLLRLAAARTGSELKLSSLGGDAGVTHNTVRAWISVLEASFLCLRLPAWHTNRRKQLIKTPKLHFLDSGLVCNLLGIHTAEQLRHHPLRGAIFESWVASELTKQRLHQGREAALYHYRDARRLEIDLLLEEDGQVTLIEVKSGATVQSTFFRNLTKLEQALEGATIRKVLVYGGHPSQVRSAGHVVSWQDLGGLDPGPL